MISLQRILMFSISLLLVMLICDMRGSSCCFLFFQLKGFTQSELLAHLYSSRDQARHFYELIAAEI